MKARRNRFVLSDLLPAAIRARGGECTRESERAFADLQAVQTAREVGPLPATAHVANQRSREAASRIIPSKSSERPAV
ncbi:hypothetical protein ACF1AJ_10985 [Leifsonia sp. NPDC014704]|uniref:hypothetical protein n=1 Tax=Leifsonia sp. NPDC014704 TaxID=3364123 RepID=UPI0036F458CC